MDDNSLRNQITAEVREEFENQFREMKREKNRAEEEFENAAERWRTERRRMNAEIDRLEEEALSKGRKVSTSADTGELQAAFDEKLQQATASWEIERDRLNAEISRLQTSLAEALSRSSNPLRTTQTIKDQYEVRLADSNRLHLEAEREFLRTKAEWEEDKKRVMGELIRLRRLVPPSALQVSVMSERLPGRTETVEEARIRELDGQLGQARGAVLRSHEASIRTAQELTTARQDVQRLNRALLELQEHMGSGDLDELRRKYEARLQDLEQQRDTLLQQVAAAAKVTTPGADPLAILPLPQPVSGFERGPVAAEMEHVETSIKAIEHLLDDPDTSASTIAQKRLEKAQLEAYLRGILFQASRAKGA